jgi:hypothetical protein
VAGMVADPSLALDHGGDAGQRPMVGVEPVDAGTLAQRLLQVVELLVGQARGRPSRAGAAQGVGAAGAPQGMPAAGVLPGDAELAGDLGLGAAGGNSSPASRRTRSDA